MTQNGRPAPQQTHGDTPSITVIIATYNDRAHLKHAVASCLTQGIQHLEVIVADDGSTDRTPAIMRRLARRDHRVRYLRLPNNTGAPGEARNRALDQARGQYVTFLDSDDLLPAGALAALHAEAQRTGADLTAGLTERVSTTTGKRRRWRPRLYETPQQLGSVLERPELVTDTISVAKLYRRDLLEREHIRFRPGVAYEDYDFTLKAWGTARGIALTNTTVYEWLTYAHKERRTLTQQRNTLANLQQRIEALRLCKDWLAGRPGADTLQVILDRKFLARDLFIYLGEFPQQPDDLSAKQLDLVRAHLERLEPAALAELPPMKRAAVRMAVKGSVEGVRQAAAYHRASGALAGRITTREDGGATWRPLVPGSGDLAVDLGDWPILDTPIEAITPYARLRRWRVADNRLILEGVWHDAIGRYDPARPAQLHVILSRYRAGADGPEYGYVFPGRIVPAWQGDDDPMRGAWAWSVAIELPKGMPLTRPNRWDVGLVVTQAGLVARGHVYSAIERDPVAGVTPPGRDRVFGRHYGPYTAGFGLLCVKKAERLHTIVNRPINATAVWLAGLAAKAGKRDHVPPIPSAIPPRIVDPPRRALVRWTVEAAADGQAGLTREDHDAWAAGPGRDWYVLASPAPGVDATGLTAERAAYLWNVADLPAATLASLPIARDVQGPNLVSAFGAPDPEAKTPR